MQVVKVVLEGWAGLTHLLARVGGPAPPAGGGTRKVIPRLHRPRVLGVEALPLLFSQIVLAPRVGPRTSSVGAIG